MRIVAIADDDSLVGKLPLDSVDLLLSLGDLLDTTIAKARDRYHPAKVLAVRGNHDSSAEFPAFISPLHLAIEKYRGVSFGGFNGCWRYKPKGHYLFDQQEVAAQLALFPRVDVFIAHNSPGGYHERDGDVHRGFKAFNDYIKRTRPRLFIHGHQHLNQVSVIGDTTLIGVFGETLLEIDIA